MGTDDTKKTGLSTIPKHFEIFVSWFDDDRSHSYALVVLDKRIRFSPNVGIIKTPSEFSRRDKCQLSKLKKYTKFETFALQKHALNIVRVE